MVRIHPGSQIYVTLYSVMSYDKLKSPTVDERVENGWGFLFLGVGWQKLVVARGSGYNFTIQEENIADG